MSLPLPEEGEDLITKALRGKTHELELALAAAKAAELAHRATLPVVKPRIKQAAKTTAKVRAFYFRGVPMAVFLTDYSTFGPHVIVAYYKVRWSEGRRLMWVMVEFTEPNTVETLTATSAKLGHTLIIEPAVASISDAHKIWIAKADMAMIGKDPIWDKIAERCPNIGGCCMCRRNTGKYSCYLKAGFETCYGGECLDKLRRICKRAGASLGAYCVEEVEKQHG